MCKLKESRQRWPSTRFHLFLHKSARCLMLFAWCRIAYQCLNSSLVEELVVLTLALFITASWLTTHAPVVIPPWTSGYFVLCPKANFLPWRVWVQEEIPLGSFLQFICIFFSILTCHWVIFGKVLLWREKLGFEQGMEESYEAALLRQRVCFLNCCIVSLGHGFGVL